MTCDHCGALIADGLAHDLNARCDNCQRPIRSQIPNTAPEGRLRDMPGAGDQPDTGGNPLREGILADHGWANPLKRDESFASVRRAEVDPNLEFEVTDVIPPASKSIEAAHTVTLNLPHGLTDNLHTALDKSKAWVENPHDNGRLCPYYKGYWRTIRPALARSSKLRIGVSDPKMAEILNHVAQTDDLAPLQHFHQSSIHTSNVFKSIWNGAKSIAPELAAGAITAAGIAATPFTGGASDAAAAAADGAILGGGEALAGGAADAAAGAAAGGATDAAAAGAAGNEASGVGGLMRGAMSKGQDIANRVKAIPGVSTALGVGRAYTGLEGVDSLMNGGGGQGQGNGAYGVGTVQPPSYYSSLRDQFLFTADADLPNVNQGYFDTNDPEKVDQKERNDGDHKNWQKDDSENGMGGADSAFGPVVKQFADALPQLLHYFFSDEDGSQDPGLQSLHQQLESLHPGYQDLADPHRTHQLLVMLAQPDGQPDADPENPTTADDRGHEPGQIGEHHGAIPNPQQPVGPPLGQQGWTDGAGVGIQTGKCPSCGGTITPGEQHCPQCGAGVGMAPGQKYSQPPTAEADALPPGTPTGVQAASHPPYGLGEGVISGPVTPEEESLQSSSWPKESFGTCPHCGQYAKFVLGGCSHCGANVADSPEGLKPYMASGVGPHTPQQIAAVQDLLIQEGRIQEVTQVPIHPENYADELSRVQNVDSPPDGDLNNNPPEPPVEQTDPNAGMPVPGMSMDQSQQMATSALKYGADSVADQCPKCGSHTTKVVDTDDGTTRCHTCHNIFKTKGLVADDSKSTDTSHTAAPHGLNHMHPNPADVSAADYEHPEDPELEQDSSQTWKDENGDPLRVGQEYEMASMKYDIPDVIRLESVKPDSISYTITGQYGLEHSTEVTHQEALMDGITFTPHDNNVDPNFDDSQGQEDQRQGPGPGEQTDLSQTHDMVSQSSVDYAEDSMPCPSCGGPNPFHLPSCPSMIQEAQSPVNTRDIEKAYRLPSAEHPLGPQTGHVSDPSLDWLKSELPHTAGANFTPMEQREFVDEQGVARNADRLDLSNTHYIDREDDVSDHFLW